jgi:hypothetical protein
LQVCIMLPLHKIKKGQIAWGNTDDDRGD